MKKLFTILLMGMFLFSFIGAESYLPHKQNTDLEFSIGSNFATSCTIDAINTPTGVKSLSLVGTSHGQSFFFAVDKAEFSNLGVHCLVISCTDGTNVITNNECREVTPDGGSNTQTKQDIYYLFFITIALLFGFILGGIGIYTDKKILVFSAMGFLVAGLVISYYPNGIENKFITDTLSILNYGIAFICLAIGIYEWLPEDN